MRLMLGSNPLPATDGRITVRGKQQIVLEWDPANRGLLVTMDLYNANGGHIARLRRNQWTFNDHERFEFTNRARGFTLVDVDTGQVVLCARVVGRDGVEITEGAFYSSLGHEIELTTEDWSGVGHSPSPPDAARLTTPPFAPDEVASIRRESSGKGVVGACPRCGSALRREDLARHAQRDGWLVSCASCGRSVIVHRPPRA